MLPLAYVTFEMLKKCFVLKFWKIKIYDFLRQIFQYFPKNQEMLGFDWKIRFLTKFGVLQKIVQKYGLAATFMKKQR